MTPDAGLVAVDAELQQELADLSGSLREVCLYATCGGRRMRAALLLGAAQQTGTQAVRAATALELIHAATLLQDDIFDAGQMRRGKATAHVRFGRAMAILASDWLLIRSLELASAVDTRFFRCLARAGSAMAQAEAKELEPAMVHSFEEAELHGTSIARGKTATLFGTALCGAAILQGVSSSRCSQWEQLGCEMGLTYQIADDCLDLYGTELCEGKSLGHDLVAGCVTLPVVLGMRLLAERGVCSSPADLGAGRASAVLLEQLRAAVQSAEVRKGMGDLLRERLDAHCRQAAALNLPLAVVQTWSADFSAKLDASLQRVVASPAALSARAVYADSVPALSPCLGH